MFTQAGPDRRTSVDEGLIVLHRSLSVRIPKEAIWDDAWLEIAVEACIAQDLEATASDALKVGLEVPDGFRHGGSQNEIAGKVEAGSEIVFVLSTAPYAEDRSVLIMPRAEPRHQPRRQRAELMTSASTIKTSQRITPAPYEGVDSLSDALAMTQLVIDGNRYPPGNVSLPRESLPIGSGAIELFVDDQGVAQVLDQLKINTKDVWIACIAFGSVVAESCILFNQSLASFQSPHTVELQGDPLVFDSPNGFDTRVALYLRSNLKPRAFRPHRSGTWLALAGFSVSPYASLSRFCPVPMDDAIRRRYGLPKGCMSYVRVGDGVLDAEALEDEIDVFVDLSILRLLQENPEEPLATYIQLDLVSETLVAIITRAAEQIGHSELTSFEDMRAAGLPIAQRHVRSRKIGWCRSGRSARRGRRGSRPREELRGSTRRNAQDHLTSASSRLVNYPCF